LQISISNAFGKYFRHTLWVILLSFVISGCGAVATRNKFYIPITADLQSRNYPAAVQSFEKAKKKFGKKDRFLYYLDSGALYYYAADYDSSISRLNLAENSAEELFTRSVSRAATSMLLNDNVLEYSGEDYEILYANLIKALGYVSLNKFDDAFVEIKRANLKLELLEQKYAGAADEFNKSESKDTAEARIQYEAGKVRFNNDAFARYLSMHLYAADGKFDDARIDFDLLNDAFLTQPHIYDFPAPAVRYAPEDSGAILSIVGMAGLSPVKEALSLRIRTDKDLGLVQVLYDGTGEDDHEYGHLLLPVKEDYYFKFAIPKIAARPTPVTSIRVYADTNYLGELALIEDVSKVAEETFNAKKSLIYLRSVARAVAKGLATHKLKERVDNDDKSSFGGWLKKAVIDVGSDISENADLRCSRFLPGKIYVGDFELPPGQYNIRIDYLDSYGAVIKSDTISDYKVGRNKLNLLKSFSSES
jgi:uncharacterized protein